MLVLRKTSLRDVCTFYVFALSLAVAVSVFGSGLGEGALALTMLTPAIGVLMVMGLFVPSGSRQAFIEGLGVTRTGRSGYGLAVAAPALIFSASLLVLVATGAASIRVDAVSSLPRLVVSSLIGLVVSTALAFCEEIGWRGYMLPKLLPIGVLPASLIVGFLHGVWHLPLILLTDLYHPGADRLFVVPMFLVTLTLAGVFYGHLRLKTGSVWPVAVAHAAVNTFWTVSATLAEMKSAFVEEYVGGESGIVMILGLLVLSVLLTKGKKT